MRSIPQLCSVFRNAQPVSSGQPCGLPDLGNSARNRMLCRRCIPLCGIQSDCGNFRAEGGKRPYSFIFNLVAFLIEALMGPIDFYGDNGFLLGQWDYWGLMGLMRKPGNKAGKLYREWLSDFSVDPVDPVASVAVVAAVAAATQRPQQPH